MIIMRNYVKTALLTLAAGAIACGGGDGRDNPTPTARSTKPAIHKTATPYPTATLCNCETPTIGQAYTTATPLTQTQPPADLSRYDQRLVADVFNTFDCDQYTLSQTCIGILAKANEFYREGVVDSVSSHTQENRVAEAYLKGLLEYSLSSTDNDSRMNSVYSNVGIVDPDVKRGVTNLIYLTVIEAEVGYPWSVFDNQLNRNEWIDYLFRNVSEDGEVRGEWRNLYDDLFRNATSRRHAIEIIVEKSREFTHAQHGDGYTVDARPSIEDVYRDMIGDGHTVPAVLAGKLRASGIYAKEIDFEYLDYDNEALIPPRPRPEPISSETGALWIPREDIAYWGNLFRVSNAPISDLLMPRSQMEETFGSDRDVEEFLNGLTSSENGFALPNQDTVQKTGLHQRLNPYRYVQMVF